MKIEKAVLLWAIVACTQLTSIASAAPEVRPAKNEFGREQVDKGKCPQKICIFMDGTCNSPDSDTNVRRLFEIVSAPRDAGILCYYDIGVGADIHKVTGAVGGYGLTKNYTEAYQFLAENYDSSDEIYLFGFSRGARQVQILCDIIDQCGIPDLHAEEDLSSKKNRRIVDSVVARYKRQLRKESRLGGKRLPRLISELGYREARVKFVGIWDCVESLGSNVLRTCLSRDGLKKGDFIRHSFYRYDLPRCVDRAYHAMAIDEQRGLYEVVPWEVDSPIGKDQVLEQVWFVGCHGDVGGGYEETQGLAGVSLNWILEQLEPENLLPTRGFRVHQSFLGPIKNTNAITVGVVLSKVRQNYPRYDQFRKFPLNAGQKPKIHFSVLERMRVEKLFAHDKDREPLKVYRPAVLAGVAGVYDIPDSSKEKGFAGNAAWTYYYDEDGNKAFGKWDSVDFNEGELREDIDVVEIDYHKHD